MNKRELTREEWNEGVKHPELMLGAVGGVSGPLVSVKAAQEAAEDDPSEH